MVNNSGVAGFTVESPTARPLRTVSVLIGLYLIVVAATLVALAVLSSTASAQASSHAWGHAIVVSVFAAVLPLRMRSARKGRRGAVRAVGIIAAVLLMVNVVEALIPGFVPTWMRVQMWAVALLMALVVIQVARWAATNKER